MIFKDCLDYRLSFEGAQIARQVAKDIEAEPESFNMLFWTCIEHNKDGSTCQTPSCIAGHIVFRSLGANEEISRGGVQIIGSTEQETIPDRAARMLGLPRNPPLFRPNPEQWWPEPWASEYEAADNPRSSARAAAGLLRAMANEVDPQ